MWRTEGLGTSASRTVGAVTDSPEFNVTVFALLLNFAWEILQSPLYVGMAELPHAQVTKVCLQATVGDALIMLIAYGTVAATARSRFWIVAASGWQLILLIAIGVSVTAAIEWFATRGLWVGSWRYQPTMPLVPGTQMGLVPLLQWVVLPPLTVWFVRRQITRRAKSVVQETNAP